MKRTWKRLAKVWNPRQAVKVLLAPVALLVLVSVVLAQGDYDLPWFTVDGGGGTIGGGAYTLSGTIGQPDAGVLSGGPYTLVGGFGVGTGPMPPVATIYASLRIEDAPPGVVVNKLVGDIDGATDAAYVDVVAYVWTYERARSSGVQVILTAPDDQLGAPVDAWVRNSNGGDLTAVSATGLGGGSYQVTTDLAYSCSPSPCRYHRQVVWRFRIPDEILPQDLHLQCRLQAPSHLTTDVRSWATLRLVRYPAAIIITNRALLYSRHTDTDVTSLLGQLYTVVQGQPHNTQPLGVIYYVDRHSDLARNWDNTNVDYTSEATANVVANEVDALIEDWVEDGDLVQYLMLVGDDGIIPSYRYHDPSNDEAEWGPDSNINPAIHVTDEDYFFTDNPYGDRGDGTDWQEGNLDLAVGRLLGDSAADMLSLLDSSMTTTGGTGRAVMASVDGWELGMPEGLDCGLGEIDDVVSVPDRLVDRGFNVLNDTESPRTVDVLGPYPTDWNSGFRNAANGGMDVFFIGGHDNYDKAYIPGDPFSPDDTCAAAGCRYNRFDDDHPLAFIVGCHGGLPVPDVDVPGGVDHDMVYDLAHEGVRAYVGATGFSYGSPGSLCYATWGERLMQHFFDEFLPVGSQSLPIGEALRQAKDNYVFGYGSKDSLDRKTVTEFTLYGVPWQRLDYPGGALTAAAEERTASPLVVTTQAGPVVQADDFRYTRTITVEVTSYEATQVSIDSITYDILSIPGEGMAIAPDLPMLPYVEGYTLTLPLSITLQGVILTGSTCADVDSYEVPIVVARPWTEGGTTFTTTTDINAFYPSGDDLVRWQRQGTRMLFTLFPIQHNPTSNATRFCSRMVFQVAYDAPLPLAVSDLRLQAEQVIPREPITVTALVENIGDDLAAVTTTLTLMNAHGRTIDWHEGGPFLIPAGGQEELGLSWGGLPDEGTYVLELALWQEGQVVGLAADRVNVIGGSLTGLEVPTSAVMPGERADFRVTFANYLVTPVTTTVHLVIYDEDGHPVEELGSQTGQVGGRDEATFTLSWQPSGVSGGTYTAWAQVEREDETTYGPAVQRFEVGCVVYLPIILHSD
jgi:hypothetical protein